MPLGFDLDAGLPDLISTYRNLSVLESNFLRLPRKPKEMSFAIDLRQPLNLRPSGRWVACSLWIATASIGLGQSPGGGPSGGLPAFNEPTFRERLYEAGGIADREVHNGKAIVALSI